MLHPIPLLVALVLLLLCHNIGQCAAQCIVAGRQWYPNEYTFEFVDILDGWQQGEQNYTLRVCDRYRVLSTPANCSWDKRLGGSDPTETSIETDPSPCLQPEGATTTITITILCDPSVGDRIVPNGTTTVGKTISPVEVTRELTFRSGCACGAGCTPLVAPKRGLGLHAASVRAVQYHPTYSTEAVSASEDKTAVLFDPGNGAVKATLMHTDKVYDAVYPPAGLGLEDEVWTVSGSDVIAWSRSTFLRLRTVATASGGNSPFGIRFHPTDPTTFALLCSPDLLVFKANASLGPISYSRMLTDVLFHPVADKLVQSGEQFRTLSLTAGNYGTQVDPILEPGEGVYNAMVVDPAASERFFVVGGGLSLYNFTTGKRDEFFPSNEWQQQATAVAASRLNPNRAAVAFSGGPVALLDGSVKLLERDLPQSNAWVARLLPPSPGTINRLVFSPTNRDELMGASSTGAVIIWRFPSNPAPSPSPNPSPSPAPSSHPPTPPGSGAAPGEGGGLGGGAIAGIVIGAVVCVALLVAAGVVLSRSRGGGATADGYQQA